MLSNLVAIIIKNCNTVKFIMKDRKDANATIFGESAKDNIREKPTSDDSGSSKSPNLYTKIHHTWYELLENGLIPYKKMPEEALHSFLLYILLFSYFTICSLTSLGTKYLAPRTRYHLVLYLFIDLIFVAKVSAGFVHPGLLHTQSDFDRMAQKVSSQAHPWIDSYNILTANIYANLSYTPSPVPYASRGACQYDNSANLFDDVAAAYQSALIWKISGNTSYADQAVRIMNAWSSTLTTIGCANGSSWDYILMAGIQGYQFANVGEIMRNYSGWSANDFARFQTMMRTIFYPINHGTLPPVQWHNYPNPLAVYANWELCCIASIIGIGVLTDNQTMFDEGIRYFQNGNGNGALAQAVYYLHPGYLGQGQEAGRDQNHNTLEIVMYSVIAQMAWNQGVDLYGYANNRILSVTEYTAKGNSIQSGSNYYTVPFSTYSFIDYSYQEEVQPTFSNISIGMIRPSWVCLYNHYVNVKGLAAPYTNKMINTIGIQGGGGDYGNISTWYDQLGFETLTCTLDNITVGVPPSGLSAILSNGNVVLSWWGTTYATSYNLYRNNCSGAYTNIANGIIDPLTYTDSNISGNTFLCYYVTAQIPSGTTNISNVANVTVDPTQLLAYLKFDETNGTVTFDSTLHGYYATLNGGATYVPGKINNAVQLDGSTGYVSLPAGLIDTLSDFTIATWVYINNQSTNARLFSFGFSPNRWMAYTPKSSNGSASFSVTLNDAGGVQSIYSPSALPIGQWVHVAVTLLGNTATYYLNGSSVGSGLINLPPFQIVGMGTTNLPVQYWIGKSQYMADPYLSGIVDDFRVYPGALTASQVSSLYNSSAVIGSIPVLVLILVLVFASKV